MISPPNFTSCEQPMDLCNIAVLKKIYKCLYIKDTICYNQLNSHSKRALKENDINKKKEDLLGIPLTC